MSGKLSFGWRAVSGIALFVFGLLAVSSDALAQAEAGGTYIGGGVRSSGVAAEAPQVNSGSFASVGSGIGSGTVSSGSSAHGVGKAFSAGLNIGRSGGSVRVGSRGLGINLHFGSGSGSGGSGGDAGAFDDASASLACTVLAIPEGAFGALVMIVSGLIAVIGAAMGMYRLALSTLVVGIGAFLIFPLVSLFFGLTC